MRFAVRFLGCKVSQADATLIRDALIDAGHVETVPERAEVHVVNTCALTLEAERKSRRQVNRAARAARTFVTGCAANLNAGQFAGPGVTVVGRSADRAAAEIVERLGGAPARLRARRAPAGRAHAGLPQGAERLRLALRLLHHPDHAGRGGEPPSRRGAPRRPPPAGRGPPGAGPDRHQHRHLARARERRRTWPTWCAGSGRSRACGACGSRPSSPAT